MPISSLRDFWRSKSRYIPSMTGAVASFAATTFTLMLGASLGVYIEVSALTRASSGFRSIFSTFILITTIFSLLLAIVTFTNLIATIMDNRAKDIAILKTSGGSVDKLYSHFMTQALQIALLLGGLSIVVGIISYSLSIFIVNLLTGLGLVFSIPTLELLAVLALLVVLSMAFGHRYVARAVRLSVAEIFSPQVRDIELLRSEGWLAAKISKPGSPLRIAFRNVRRTRRFTLRLATCIFLSMILTTSITLGGVVADQTTVNYVNSALSENFIFVGHQQMWVQYSSLVGFQISPSYNSSFNYLRPEYRINDSLVSQVALLPGVLGVDPRLVYETQLKELSEPAFIDTGNGTTETVLVGDSRTATVLVSGIDPEKVITNWYHSGRLVNSSDYPLPSGGYSAITIGDSVNGVFDDINIEKASILGKQFIIVGTVLDPVDSGWTVYMLHNVLSSLLAYNYSNMMLVKCDPGSYSETLALIQNTVVKYGLSAFPMAQTVHNLSNFVNFTWVVSLIPVLLLLLTLAAGVISYMNIAFETERKDFGIMRGVGAPPKHTRRTILNQGIIVSLWPGVSGIIIGLIVAIWFFIPAAVFSPLLVLTSSALLMLLLFSSSFIASVISSRVSKKPIIEIMK
jgi:ABC-type antimicrobial peptide transport system permease subunit